MSETEQTSQTENESVNQSLADQVKALQEQLKSLMPQKTEESDLMSKVQSVKDERGKEQDLESALKFNLTINDFLKGNESILPSEINDLIEIQKKEKYDSAVEQADSFRVAMLQSFFQVQENLDLLTTSQKNQVETFLKLTKNGKQQKARDLYESVFEPTVEMMKKIKRAEELAKGPTRSTSSHEERYKQKLINLSAKRYLRSN